MPPKQSGDADAPAVQEQDSTIHVAGPRSGKRANTAGGGGGPGSGKRRMAYAPRACDSCRRRKGKCDGNSPCDYCVGRGQPCNYSLTSSDWRSVLSNVPTAQASNNAPINHVGHMMMNLQNKLDSLTALIQQQTEGSGQERRSSIAKDASVAERSPVSRDSEPPSATSEPPAMANSPKQDKPSSEAGSSSHAASTTGIKFFGHISPDYSFHVASNKLLRDRAGGVERHGRLSIPGVDHDTAATGSAQVPGSRPATTTPGSERRGAQTVAGLSPSTFTSLAELPLRMTSQEALRLIGTYDQVVGERNPFVNLACLREQIDRWYEWGAGAGSITSSTPNACPLDEDDALILLLVISIALAAELSSATTSTCEEFYARFEESIKAKLISPSASLRDVIITLLAAHYHYFRGTGRTAWRLTGLAGSMFMELGLHNTDVLKHCLETDAEREVAAIVACAAVTLDHQFSAAMGLPTHSREMLFPQDLLAQVKTPYLSAMMSFLRISEMVSGTISRAIQSGSYDDDDAFELANFQIEQWRRKALSAYAPGLLERGYSASDGLSSWMLLLYLRANSVKNMLLRPLFFSNGRRPAAERQIKPALDLISDSINTLMALDKATDLYRNQHAHFQHMLSGACALMFLVLAYVAENSQFASTLHSEQPDLSAKLLHVYESAVALSRAYSGYYKASEVLLQRLMAMTPILNKLNIVYNGNMQPAGADRPDPSIPAFQPAAELNGQQDHLPKGFMPVSPPTEGPNPFQMPVQGPHSFMSPNAMGQTSWPSQPMSNSASGDMVSIQNSYVNDNMMSFGGVPSTPGNLSMMRWLMTNGESMVQPLQQWPFPGEDELFGNWNNS